MPSRFAVPAMALDNKLRAHGVVAVETVERRKPGWDGASLFAAAGNIKGYEA